MSDEYWNEWFQNGVPLQIDGLVGGCVLLGVNAFYFVISCFAILAAVCRIRGSFRKKLHCILIIQQWKRLLLSDSFGFGMSSLVIFRCYFGVLFLLSKSSRLLDVDYANSSKL